MDNLETSIDLYREGHPGAQQAVLNATDLMKPNEESWSNRIVNFQLTFAAFLLFTASFTFIGLLSAPMLSDEEEL